MISRCYHPEELHWSWLHPMLPPALDNLSALLDDAKCFALVRQHRWPDGVRCPACASGAVIRDGCDDRQANRQRYRCKACSGRFDDLTGTVLAGHHQPLRVWVLCLYFMGLNLSTRQIAQAGFPSRPIIEPALIVLTMRHSGTADAGRWRGSALAAWRGFACD